MVYKYDKNSKRVKIAKMPKIVGEDAKRIIHSKVPVKLLDRVASMNFNRVKA